MLLNPAFHKTSKPLQQYCYLLKRILAEQGQCENVSQFQALPEDKKTLLLQLLLSSGGSIRQVSRLTGTSFGIVRKYG